MTVEVPIMVLQRMPVKCKTDHCCMHNLCGMHGDIIDNTDVEGDDAQPNETDIHQDNIGHDVGNALKEFLCTNMEN